MQATVHDLGNLKRSLEIEIPLAEIQPTYNQILQQIKSTKVRGFRPGRFPKGWIKKRFDEAMNYEANKTLIPNYYNQAIEDKGLKLAVTQGVERLSYGQGKPLTFQISFEVKPPFSLPDIAQLKLEKKEVAVSDENKQEMFENFLASHSQEVPKEADSMVAEGDVITVDYTGKIDGIPVADKSENIRIQVGKSFPEFTEHLLGMKVDETKTFDLILPESYLENAGKNAEFELKVNTLLSLQIPELNEAFFEKFSDFSNEEELHQNLEQQLIKTEKEKIQQEYRTSLHTQLKEIMEEFELPEILVETERKKIQERLEKETAEISEEEKTEKQQQQLEDFKKQTRLEYLLEEIGHQESIKPNEDSVLKQFTQVAMLMQKSPQEFFETQLGKSLYLRAMQNSLEDQVLDFLVSKVLGEQTVTPINES